MNSVSECQQIVDDLIAMNPRFSALLNNGDMARTNVDCRVCADTGIEANKSSFLTKNPHEIVVCANNIKKTELKKELMFHASHAYDLNHERTDANTCEGIAYVKVRAFRDAQCSNLPFKWMHGYCTGTLAGVATKALHRLSGDQCVAAVFEKAMADMHPIPGEIDPLSKINKGPA